MDMMMMIMRETLAFLAYFVSVVTVTPPLYREGVCSRGYSIWLSVQHDDEHQLKNKRNAVPVDGWPTCGN